MARKAPPSRWIAQAFLATVLIAGVPGLVDAEPSAAAIVDAPAGAWIELPSASEPPAPAPEAPLDFARVAGVEPAGLAADAGINVGATAPQVDVGF